MDLRSELQKQLVEIDARLSGVVIGADLRSSLVASRETLNNLYQMVLARGNVLTADEKTRIETELNTAKQEQLRHDAKKSKTIMTVAFFGGVILLIAGIWYYQKQQL